MAERVLSALFGIFGMTTIIPHGLLCSGESDISEKNMYETKVSMGLTSSGLMVSSGIMGVFHHSKYLPIKYSIMVGCLGVTTHLLTFSVPSIYRFFSKYSSK